MCISLKKFVSAAITAIALPAMGQTVDLALYQPSEDSIGFIQKTNTVPTDDAVLQMAPTEINLNFPQQVRLVKLTLRNEQRDWVDIDFRYDPQFGISFKWGLPQLNAANYYTADWAVLAANDRLVRGSFSFSFGPEAKPPSIVKEADTLLMQLRYGDPNVRSVMPPRTEIIIKREPPQYDPPFTINLNPSIGADPC